MDEPNYVGFTVEGQDIGCGSSRPQQGHDRRGWLLARRRHPQDLEGLLDAGAVEHRAIQDVGGGKLVASVTDAEGNVIGLFQTP